MMSAAPEQKKKGFCLLGWFVFVCSCCLVIPVSSREMQNYVILSMTATIVMMRAAMEQKTRRILKVLNL